MIKKKILLSAIASLMFAASSTHAAVSEAEAQALGTKLTPFGAEKAGNADGSIPEWTGGITSAPAGYTKSGQHHIDPFPGDKPKFVITKDNLDKYKGNLTEGEVALFKTYPDTFKIPVYETRRTAAAPQWVYDNTKKNAVTAKLVEGGNGFENAYGGIPFPIPKNGLEAIWNHVMRYRGTYVEMPVASGVVYANGTRAMMLEKRQSKFKFYIPGGSFDKLNNIAYLYINSILAPARDAGNSALVQETLNQMVDARSAWAYVPGTRRVRRAPTLGYDSPASGTDGIMTIDNTDMFNGSPDRFDWTLVGKKEIYIPYNSYRISKEGVKYTDVMTPNHLNPDYTRFELHRVWVVEAKLKSSARHIYSKRTFYIDEDSWQISLIDQYDSRGELWRTSMAHIKNFYELPTTWVAAEVHHDLLKRSYYVTTLDSEESKVADFSIAPPNDDFFTADALRRRNVR